MSTEENDSNNTAGTDVNREISVLHRKRGNLKATLTRFSTFLNGIKSLEPDQGKLTELQLRITKLKANLLSDFEAIQFQIEDIEQDNFDPTETETFEKQYFAVLAEAENVVSKFNKHFQKTNDTKAGPSQPAPSTSQESGKFNPGIKLPTIELPKFDGTYEQWLEFRDLFSSLIHNSEHINPISKFHYLRASLEGSAAQCIKSIEFTSENYSLAWEILIERFNNKRLMVHNHLKSLVNISEVKSESATGLRSLVDTMSKNLRSLTALGLPTDKWDVLVIHLVVNKLDSITVREWEERTSKDELPTLEEFSKFLKNRAEFLEKIDLHKSKVSKSRDSQRSLVANVTKDLACFICKKNHTIYACPEFSKMSVSTRLNKARDLKLCNNCLRNNHSYKDCRGGTCRKCKGNHHTLLHLDRDNRAESEQNVVERNRERNPSPAPSQERPDGDKQKIQACHSYTVSTKMQILLSTVSVDIADIQGNKHTCRAMLDSGSMSNFISKSLLSKLRLPTTRVNVDVTGIGQVASKINSACEIFMYSKQNSFDLKLRCLVIQKITDELPNSYINPEQLRIPQHLNLADPKFNEPGDIDLLIGASVFYDILRDGKIRLGTNMPIMQNSKLGWIISGPLNTLERTFTTVCNFSNSNHDIQGQIAKFWEIEEVSSQPLSPEESLAEQHFSDTFKRDYNGRFIVAIPMKDSITKLGDSRQSALKQFLSLERKLSLNPKLKHMYLDFMSEYEELSHMSRFTPKNDQICFYSPHHGVLKEESLSTKLRVVFNSSARSSSGVSYNDLQIVGPKIQEDLISILLRFRQHRFVVSGDIAKMYRQVLVADEFKPLQLILWRSNPDSELNAYSLNTVTYGTASAAFLAIRCLKQLSVEHEDSHPVAARVISRDFYVDDLLTGSDTVESTVHLCQQISSILKSACFELRKWQSNSPDVLDGIKASISSNDTLHFGPEDSAKTLGLLWSCKDDTFCFHIGPPAKATTITKRAILSDIAKIFDPLGLISPCIITAKIILQELWGLKLSWDDKVPYNLLTKWSKFHSEISELSHLSIPRHIACKTPALVELHGFADASMRAYGCCIYIRSVSSQNQVEVHLLCSKTRVAPLKSISIPRLELCGAQMLARLYERVTNSLTMKIDAYFMWSDSTVCLAWIRTPPHTLQTFVANRVAEVQRLTNLENWRTNQKQHLVSRTFFDISLVNPIPQEEIPEKRKHVQSLATINAPALFPFERFSSLSRLKRVLAYVRRFINNCRSSSTDRITGVLSQQEINQAHNVVLKLAQRESFPKELFDLQRSNAVSSKSRLLSLTPFINEDGIIRVGGRLRHSPYVFERKHPAVLCSKHHLTYLIFNHYHRQLLHCGPQSLLSAVREVCWPIAGKNLAKRVVRSCIVCCRHKPTFNTPLMGDLPKQRVTPSLPFENSGVDYAGPFIIKDRKGRGCKTLKCYLCLFICLASKAVHLELVTELSTPAFLEMLQRFISRRGKPLSIHSDNGSNFVGANSQLKELGKFLLSSTDSIAERSDREFNINWQFIPAYSPHMGGLWEAGVKSAKHHIKRVMGNALLTYESFYTLIVQIEGILNSRPLTPLSTDPNDLEALTPAHLLIGRSIQSIPVPDVREVPIGRLSQFQRIQQIKQHFWSRWAKEYVSQLQERVKWRKDKSTLQLGVMVLIKDDHLPPSRWQLGRIVELHPGADNIVRVVSIKTGSGIIKRSVVKVCPLPTNT